MADRRAVHRVTLDDVAREAAVSKTTASRALAQVEHPDVGAVTRDRVRDVAQRLGYRPSATARALRTGRFKTLSVLTPVGEWAWWEPMLQGAAAEAERLGFQLLVHPLRTSADGLDAVLSKVQELPTDGLLLVTLGPLSAYSAKLQNLGMPFVLIDDKGDYPWAATVCGNNREGGYQATRHLLECGRRRIAVIAPEGDVWYVRERIDGYRSALREAGLQVQEDLILISNEPYSRSLPWSPAVEHLLAKKLQFDGIFALNDFLAAPALRSLRRAGLEVPADISIVGFDDERAAELVDPPLSTIHQPFVSMGETAVRLLIRALEQKTLQPGRRELPVQLVVRESSVPTILTPTAT